MANRTIRTAKNRKAILDDLAVHGRISKAITNAGLSRSAVKDWRDAEPDFEQEIQRLIEITDEGNTEKVVDALLSSAITGNVTAMIFWLKNHAPHKYSDRQTLEHTGKDGSALTIILAERPDGPA